MTRETSGGGRRDQTVPAWRTSVRPEDAQIVRALVESTGFFAPHEVEVAVELVTEHLARGTASGYHFVFAELDGRTVGYACYGPIACTLHSFDLYWIVVHRDFRGKGLGRQLLAEAEQRVLQAGGHRVYIETSSRELYAPTRGFYERCGYVAEARLRDFYAPGDDKVVYVRALR